MARCNCFGCRLLGHGACGCARCADCGEDFDVVLECVDEETNRYRCAECAAVDALAVAS